MENRSQILSELQAISPVLAKASPGMPYQLPEGYFNQFPGLVMDRLLAIHALPENRQQYRVPQGYFESLAATMLEKIRQESAKNEVSRELEEIAPLLNSIRKSNVFGLPHGYFEELQVRPPRRAKRVLLGGWMRYAAAAVISGILVTGAFMYTDNSSGKASADNKVVPAELDKVSENEMVSYLDNPEHIQTGSNDMLQEVKNHIHTVSDEELGNYLNEHSDELVTTVAN